MTDRARTERAWRRVGVAVVMLVGLVACKPELQRTPQGAGPVFPPPDRRVAEIISPSWDSEVHRDEVGEAERVMSYLNIGPGMRVADIGAGSGYYAVRIAERVGPTGVVYAEDIVPDYLDSLRLRIAAENLANVRPISGTSADPKLPVGEVDVMLLSHMYHEIENPYEFLWNAQPSFAPGGKVGIIDLERETWRHGTPIPLLTCELEKLGYTKAGVYYLEPAAGYLAIFNAPTTRPDPATLTACAA